VATAVDRNRPTASPGGGPRLPEILGPWETVLWLWRRLRKMSTALWLLFALAAASVVATFIPQEPVIPTTVADWRSGTEGPGAEVASAFDALGLFDVYGSWWFAGLVVVLFVSLTGCLIPRWTAFVRQVRRPPVAGYRLDRLTNRKVFPTGLDEQAALDAVESVMTRRRFRRLRRDGEATRSGAAQLATERGHWREGGSLVFHSSFYVLLVGVVVAHGFGFVGQVNVTEGGGFTDTRISYERAEPGRWFDLDDHEGFQVRLDEFDVAWHPDLTPQRFVSTVTILEDGEEVRTGEVQVNHPLSHGGMTLYQMRFGMAPHVTVRSGDEVLFDERVRLGQGDANTWTGAAKVSMSDPQIALELLLLPDYDEVDGQVVNRGPEPNNPRLFANLWVGDLGLQRPVPATEFDRERGSRLAATDLGEGDVAELLGDQLVVEFSQLDLWSGFQVAHQRGRGILLLAGVLILAGLIPSLYAYRRRVWAEARDGEVLLAGVALQRKDVFAEEFAQISGEVADALGGASGQERRDEEAPG
jgi:cytochrome c biogenesis protein